MQNYFLNDSNHIKTLVNSRLSFPLLWHHQIPFIHTSSNPVLLLCNLPAPQSITSYIAQNQPQCSPSLFCKKKTASVFQSMTRLLNADHQPWTHITHLIGRKWIGCLGNAQCLRSSHCDQGFLMLQHFHLLTRWKSVSGGRSDVDSWSIKWLKGPPLAESGRVKHHTGRVCCVCFTEGFYASAWPLHTVFTEAGNVSHPWRWVCIKTFNPPESERDVNFTFTTDRSLPS